jgi:hypothetical protein
MKKNLFFFCEKRTNTRFCLFSPTILDETDKNLKIYEMKNKHKMGKTNKKKRFTLVDI